MRRLLLFFVAVLCADATHAGEGKPEPRIINGAAASSCPYQARVQITVGSSSEFCGGVIVHESYVLTAAHCCDNFDPSIQTAESTFTVTAGTLYRTSGGVSRSGDRVYIHPKWDASSYAQEQGYDLCLIHLSLALPLSDTVATIAVGDSNPAPGTLVRVTGWGSTVAYAQGTSSQTSLSEVLQEAWLTVLSQSTVNTWFTTKGGIWGCTAGNDVAVAYNFTGIIATGNDAGTVYDACQGDSGGPIAVKNSDGSYTLVGAVSHGFGCGQALVPSFQASVVASREWVELVIAGVSQIQVCGGRTCGPGAVCSGSNCVCQNGYYNSIGYSNSFGYTCRRWLNNGNVLKIGAFYALYELVPVPSRWNSNIIRSFGAPAAVASVMTSCGYNFYPTSQDEGTTVVSQLSTYVSTNSLGSLPSTIWTAIAMSSNEWVAYLSISRTSTLNANVWAPGQPSGGSCAAMLTSGSSAGMWSATSCDSSLWYIVRYTSATNPAQGSAGDGSGLAPSGTETLAVMWWLATAAVLSLGFCLV